MARRFGICPAHYVGKEVAEPGTTNGCPVCLEEAVARSNDQAVENGYDLEGWSAEEIAADLKDYDAAFEEVDSELLVEPIRKWQERRAQ